MLAPCLRGSHETTMCFRESLCMLVVHQAICLMRSYSQAGQRLFLQRQFTLSKVCRFRECVRGPP